MMLTFLVGTFELAARCALLVAHGGGDGNTNRQVAQEKLAGLSRVATIIAGANKFACISRVERLESLPLRRWPQPMTAIG
jgi:hypothetical protein